MELASDFLQLIQDVVLRPSLASAVSITLTSFVNELFAILPYGIVLSGQLFFLEDSLSVELFFRLLVFVALPIGVGGAFGSLLVYGIAYFGGKPAIERFGKYLRFSWQSVEKLGRTFRGSWYDEILFLALRSIPFIPPLPVSAAAGVIRMHPLSYLVFTCIGFIIRMMLLFLFVGFGIVGAESLAQ